VNIRGLTTLRLFLKSFWVLLMVWKCRKCGKLLIHPDDDIEHEEWHETVVCPKCRDELVPLTPFGEEDFIDFLVCPSCRIGFHPETLKPLVIVVGI